MKYIKLFEETIRRDRYITVKVDKLSHGGMNIGKEYNYKLHINGKEFLYNTFPFVKDQDNFEIVSETPQGYEIKIDKDTFDKNRDIPERHYEDPKFVGKMQGPFKGLREDLIVNADGKMEGPYDDMEIVVESDFDGYFENLVKQAIELKKSKGEKFKYKKVIIMAGPYRDYDMQGFLTKEGDLKIDFYSAIRNGFGSGQGTVENILTML